MTIKLFFIKILGHITGRYPKLVLSLRYYKKFHRLIDLNNPKLFYDKIFWNSLYTDTSQWTLLADKYKVREYVENKCNKKVLPNLLGVYDRPEDIDFEKLPSSFVIKTNNGCASNIIVRDKKLINKSDICEKMNYWLKYPYGDLTGQKHYSRILPKIIIEEMLIQDGNPNAPLTDYKFYCFNGVPMYCIVMVDRVFNTHQFHYMMYDMKWNALPDFFETNVRLKEVPKPQCFEKMISISKALSAGFNFVRIDLYDINGNVIFGEMTFMPGMSVGLTYEKQTELGHLMK